MRVKQDSSISNRSLLELQLERQMLDAGISNFETQFKFHPKRKWKSDFCIVPIKLLIEVEGGAWGGRHTYGKGFIADCEKYNEAEILGYHVIRVTADMINSPDLKALDFVKRAIKSLTSKR